MPRWPMLTLLALLGFLSLIAAVAFSIGQQRTRRSSRAARASASPQRHGTSRPGSQPLPSGRTPQVSRPGFQSPVAQQHRPSLNQGNVPSTLPVRTRQWFFSRSECAFFKALEAALPAGYRVFPNVRLNDLFLIQPGAQQRATYSRLRDKHVDFLIVRTEDFRPWMAIELDGASHDEAQQQYRDAVKDVVFRSAGLPLLRLRAESSYGTQELALLLAPYLNSHRTRTVA